MSSVKYLPRQALRDGLVMLVPGWRRLVRPQRTGGTVDPDYCYSTWLRHLVRLHQAGLPTNMKEVAELGPGDSLGVGLAALLSGVERYHALDIVAFTAGERDRRIFDALLDRFRRRCPIPHGGALERVRPPLHDYAFPGALIGDAVDAALSPERVERIRAALEDGKQADSPISYRAPWTDHAVFAPDSLDHVYSQAVLEHVDHLADIYASLYRWLRPGGTMSHTIDFRCHGTATAWNGHWTYGDRLWSFIRGGRPYLINREPYTTHLKMMKEAGFEVMVSDKDSATNSLQRSELAPRFAHLSDDELTTSGLFVIARKPPAS